MFSSSSKGPWVGHGRIVDEHHDRLAPDVHVLVVIPPVLRRDDAVADENNVGPLDSHLGNETACNRHVVCRETPGEGLPARDDCERRLRGETDKGDVLDVAAIRIPWLQAEGLELIRQVAHCQPLALGSRGPPSNSSDDSRVMCLMRSPGVML